MCANLKHQNQQVVVNVVWADDVISHFQRIWIISDLILEIEMKPCETLQSFILICENTKLYSHSDESCSGCCKTSIWRLSSRII